WTLVAVDIEQVILNLEGDPRLQRETSQLFELGRGCTADDASAKRSHRKEGPRLALGCVEVVVLSHRVTRTHIHVERLTDGHVSSELRHQLHQPHLETIGIWSLDDRARAQRDEHVPDVDAVRDSELTPDRLL